jgi:hypothetical protein
MSDAGDERALPVSKRAATDHELDEAAERYLDEACGDPAAALLKALSEGHAISRLVSRVFHRSEQMEHGTLRAA